MNDIRRAVLVSLSLAALAVAGVAHAAAADEDPYALEGRAMREPNNLQVMLKAGRVFTKRYDESRHPEDLSKAERYLQLATQLSPTNNDAKARYAVARGLRARDKNDKSLAHTVLKMLDECVTAEPQNPVYHELRGFVDVEVPGDFGRMDQGLADLQMVDGVLKGEAGAKTKYDLDIPKVYVKLGKAYRAKGKLAEAKAAWQAAIDAGPSSKDADTAKKLLSKFN